MAEGSQVTRMYVDPDRCTGCSICTQVCNRGAISLVGDVAQIDEALCIRCGLCAEECPLGAIVSLEIASPEQGAGLQTEQTTRFALSPQLRAAQPEPTSTTSSPSKAQMLERALSGLMTVAGWILDRRATQGRAQPLCGRGFPRKLSGGQGRGGGRRARRRSRRFR